MTAVDGNRAVTAPGDNQSVSAVDGDRAVNAQSQASALLAELGRFSSVAVAFSGGVDSALVLAAAARALGADRVLAVTALSQSYPSGELEPATRFAAGLGVRLLTVATHELAVPGYRANGPDRCYFCKSEVLDVVAGIAAERGILTVCTGTNGDDAHDPFRPGIRAGDERAVATPLRTLGFSKAAVRAVSALWQLPTSSKPASPCLASRIRHGVEVTGERLARVDRAELALRQLIRAGSGAEPGDLRVRDLGDDCRIEVAQSLLGSLQGDPEVLAAVRAAGFTGAVHIARFVSGALSLEAVRRA